ncbi:LytR/AlgR family response regulator transcription factor [Fulvivirga lutimaris]|uniref:LytR/AlgR family response regulator transcription factor n=1 Tax=Fulvivirga lutimaris TaxID=1819566 RepID=UPI0012BC314D|nr:LytTR family DNA-binding domain-containing protein [Fulvivirga lutimaris]MTI41447.1 response regulator transcription factor [Fulvivirga lutimaris]
MKILIIEDEAPAFRRLQKVLEEINPDIEIVEVIDSVEESVKWLGNNDAPDLIFMDIQLSDGISFEIFEKVKIIKPVIFTTAFDEYMLKAFKVNSIDYLLKPVKREELAASLQKYNDLKSSFSSNGTPDLNALIGQIRMDDKKYKSRFLIKQGERLISVETVDIAYFYTRNGVVYLVTMEDKKYLMDSNLDELVNQLDPEKFYRANRQYLISFQSINATHKYHKGKLLIELHQKTDDPVTVSVEKATDFKNWLGD